MRPERGGRRASGDLAETQCGVPLGCARRAGAGLGAHARGLLGQEAADVLSLESPLGCGRRGSCSRLRPRRAAQVPTPFSEGKCQQNWKPVAGRAAEPAGTTGTALGWRPGSPPLAHGCRLSSPGLSREGAVTGPAVSPLGSYCQSQQSGQLFWSWSPMTSFLRTDLLCLFSPWCFRVEQTKMRRSSLALLI